MRGRQGGLQAQGLEGSSPSSLEDALAAALSLGSVREDRWHHRVRLTHAAAGLAGLRVLAVWPPCHPDHNPGELCPPRCTGEGTEA